MQRVRFGLTLAIFAVCLFVATNPVFAATEAKPPTTGGATDPGKPVLPEAPLAILLPIIGIVVIGLAFFFIQRRNRAARAAE